MQVFLCLSCIHSLERGDFERYGTFQWFLNSGFVQCSFYKTLNLNVSDVDVYFYNYANDDPDHFKIHDAANGILTTPDLDRSRRLIVYVPGSTSNITSVTVSLVTDAFRDDPNCYIIVVDYVDYQNDPKTDKKSYKHSVLYSYYIGKAIAGMLSGLRKGGIKARNMQCVGYSLGGQIVGYTGQIFYQKTGEKLNRITALDPAGPCFSKRPIKDHVRSGLAEYVEVYHCNAGEYGTDRILGDIDFFLNKRGQIQPNCRTPFIPTVKRSRKAALCSHLVCLEAWVSTIQDRERYTAVKCDSYNVFRDGLCEGNNTTLAGFWNPGTAKGTYYFNTLTNGSRPYAIIHHS